MPDDVAPKIACPLSPDQLARREWPQLRASCIDIAATLDRLDTCGEAADTVSVKKQAEALLRLLLEPAEGADRAERLLRRLSRDYDPGWKERFSAGQALADPTPDTAPEAR